MMEKKSEKNQKKIPKFFPKSYSGKKINFKDKKTVLIRNLVLFFSFKKPY